MLLTFRAPDAIAASRLAALYVEPQSMSQPFLMPVAAASANDFEYLTSQMNHFKWRFRVFFLGFVSA